MKSTPFLVATILFLFFFHFSNAQVQTARTNSINGNCGGYYEYLPQGYSSNSWQSYPLIVAVHGIGELGNGTSDLPNILNCWTSLTRRIANGGFPTSFSVGGQSFSFIVISPQFKSWPSSGDVNDVVNYAIQNYRVDQSRIYVTGLSMGGGAVWTFAGDYPTKAAAIVPVCGAWTADAGRAQAISNAKLAVWATHNQDDPTVGLYNTTGWVDMIKQYGGDIISTIFPVSGHDAWSRTYDPSFTQNGVNIYQWMLQHQKGGGSTPPPAAPNQAPSVSTTGDQTITLPQSSVTLSANASDPDGSIASYQWSQLSGPSQASIASASAASTTVNNLIQGSYAFRITVTDNKGATAVSDVVVKVDAAAAPNQAPSVSTTGDQTITLPQSSVTLSANASDPDGSIASYQWSQLSGPSQASIASASAASTTVNNLIQGSYAFRITVTDNKGATAVSDVVVKVDAAAAPNQAPSVSTTGDQTITLPQSSVTLSANASDPDGSIASYQWSQLSGPSQASIASASAASTTVNNLIQGSYAFRITVTDNKGATAVSDVVVKVDAAAAPNQAPSVSTTGDQTITLPQSSVTLSANASDPDGSIASYQWSQLSGPSQASIASASAASTTVNNLIQGSYAFRITVTDNKGATAVSDVVVKVDAAAAPNQAPSVSTTGDQTITLPQSSVTLSANASDPDGSIASYQWSQLSGPSQASIASASAASTTVNNLIQGSYAFRITVTDNKGATAVSDVVVKVDAAAAPNQAPTANAGSDQTITLPVNSITLSGSGSDPDGIINRFEWSQTSGPSQATIVSVHSANTEVNNLAKGKYVFSLTITDDRGATAISSVTITVNPAPNKPPVANAGTNQTITLPKNSAKLDGAGTDIDGFVTAYNWTQVSGPSPATITAATSASTSVSNLSQGVYVFNLKVTDNNGATATADVTIRVNHAPVANAGADRVITLPINYVALSGTATDPDGSVASYQWSQIAGPTKTSFASSSPLSFIAHNLEQGIYIFRLTVTDNDGAMVWSDIKVTVLPDATKPSTATVYPNPATNILNIKIDAVTLQSYSSLEIKNAAGTVLYKESFVRSEFRMIKQVDISKLHPGVYFLTVVTDINTSKTLKFVKQ